MPSNLFISGIPKAGKTTLLRRIIWELKQKGVNVGGFVSPEEKSHGARSGFLVMNIESGKTAQLADIKGSGPRVNKYYVDVRSFEDLVLPIFRNREKYDLIVIDEIGVMELKSKKFSDCLDSVLESDIPVLASLHNDLFDEYADLGQVIELEESAREIAYGEIKNRVLQTLKTKRETEKSKKPVNTTKQSKQKPETQKRKPARQRKPQTKTEKMGFFDTLKSWLGWD